jgi:hypothetical protein
VVGNSLRRRLVARTRPVSADEPPSSSHLADMMSQLGSVHPGSPQIGYGRAFIFAYQFSSDRGLQPFLWSARPVLSSQKWPHLYARNISSVIRERLIHREGQTARRPPVENAGQSTRKHCTESVIQVIPSNQAVTHRSEMPALETLRPWLEAHEELPHSEISPQGRWPTIR